MSSLIVCHACDLVHRIDRIEDSARVRCVRCRAELYRTSAESIDRPLALAASALVLFILGIAYPLATLDVNGSSRFATLASTVTALYEQGYGLVALLVLTTAMLVPLGQVLIYLYVLIALRGARLAPGQKKLLRAMALLRPWAMPEVFTLGALVALVKLSAMAEIMPRVSLISYGLFMLALSALIGATPTEQLWRWVERCAPRVQQ